MKDIKTILQELNSITDLNKENVMAKMVDVLNANDPHLKLSDINGRFTLKITNRGSLISEEEATFEMCTLLHVAAASNNERIVKLLIELGADVNSKDACDRTSLHYAAMRGSRKATEVLINSYIYSEDFFKKPPFYYEFTNKYLKTTRPLAWRHIETPRLSIDRGADRSCIKKINYEKADNVFAKTFLLTVTIENLILLYSLMSAPPINDIHPITKILILGFVISIAIACAAIIGGIAYVVAHLLLKHDFNSKLGEEKPNGTEPGKMKLYEVNCDNAETNTLQPANRRN